MKREYTSNLRLGDYIYPYDDLEDEKINTYMVYQVTGMEMRQTAMYGQYNWVLELRTFHGQLVPSSFYSGMEKILKLEDVEVKMLLLNT